MTTEQQYTPATEEVRAAWQEHFTYPSVGELGEQFDRFLAQVRAEALREAATGARSTRFQIAHGEHVTYTDTFEAGVRSVQQMLFAGADYAEARADRIADTNHTNRCPKCGVTVTDQTPSTFYGAHDEKCGGPLEEPAGEEQR